MIGVQFVQIPEALNPLSRSILNTTPPTASVVYEVTSAAARCVESADAELNIN